MGWASYFEDVSHHQQDAEFQFPVAGIGPAGVAPPILSPALAAAFDRLRANYASVRGDVIHNCERGQWGLLSQRMDILEQEVVRFDTATLMAAQDDLLLKAGSVSEQINSVLIRAKSVLASLGRLLFTVFSELENIQRLKKGTCNSLVSKDDRELEKNSFWLFNGWKALASQVHDLEERAVDLQIRLAGDIQDRLMSHPRIRIIDKDE